MKKDNKFALKNLTKDDLYRLYWVDELSQWQIAKKYGVTQGAVFCRMKKLGIKARPHDDSLIALGKSGRFSGEKNPRWNGGRHINKQGYVMLRDTAHPLADNRGYVKEHRKVWYDAHGAIPKGSHVHHINGDKQDNRLENLIVLSSRDHRMVIPELWRIINQQQQTIKELQHVQ